MYCYLTPPTALHGGLHGRTRAVSEVYFRWSGGHQVKSDFERINRRDVDGAMITNFEMFNSLSVNYVIVFIYHALQSISTIQKFAKFLFCLVTVTRPLCARSPDRLLVTSPGVVLPELVLHLPLLHPQPVGVHSEAGGGGGSRS